MKNYIFLFVLAVLFMLPGCSDTSDNGVTADGSISQVNNKLNIVIVKNDLTQYNYSYTQVRYDSQPVGVISLVGGVPLSFPLSELSSINVEAEDLSLKLAINIVDVNSVSHDYVYNKLTYTNTGVGEINLLGGAPKSYMISDIFELSVIVNN